LCSGYFGRLRWTFWQFAFFEFDEREFGTVFHRGRNPTQPSGPVRHMVENITDEHPICIARDFGCFRWELYPKSAAFRSYQNTSLQLDVQREFATSAAIETRRNDAIAPIEAERYLSNLLRVQSSTLRSLKREKSFTFAVTSINSLTWAMAAI